MSDKLPPLDPLQRYSVNEACAYLRVSRAYLYKAIGRGELATVRDGGRQFVPGTSIAARSAADSVPTQTGRGRGLSGLRGRQTPTGSPIWDLFAAHALSGLLASGDRSADVAEIAASAADALINERRKRGPA